MTYRSCIVLIEQTHFVFRSRAPETLTEPKYVTNRQKRIKRRAQRLDAGRASRGDAATMKRLCNVFVAAMPSGHADDKGKELIKRLCIWKLVLI